LTGIGKAKQANEPIKEQRHRDFLHVYSSLHQKFHKQKSFSQNSVYFTSCFVARAHRRRNKYFQNAPHAHGARPSQSLFDRATRTLILICEIKTQ